MSAKPLAIVAGGTSFLARHLLPELLEAGWSISATYRDRPAPIDSVSWMRADLGSVEPTAAWPRDCNAVVYLAQSRQWRQFPNGVEDVFNVNVRGVARAAEYARAVGAATFLFASTGSVYGGRRDTGEHQPISIAQLQHFYVAAKLAAEALLAPYTQSMRVIVLRLFVPYGVGQNDDMLMPQLVRKVREGLPIQLAGADGLHANPVAARDVAHAIALALRLPHSATLNVAGPEALSLRAIGETIGRVVGHPPVFEPHDGAPQHLVGSTAALAAALGWVPQIGLEDGLRRWLCAE